MTDEENDIVHTSYEKKYHVDLFHNYDIQYNLHTFSQYGDYGNSCNKPRFEYFDAYF